MEYIQDVLCRELLGFVSLGIVAVIAPQIAFPRYFNLCFQGDAGGFEFPPDFQDICFENPFFMQEKTVGLGIDIKFPEGGLFYEFIHGKPLFYLYKAHSAEQAFDFFLFWFSGFFTGRDDKYNKEEGFYLPLYIKVEIYLLAAADTTTTD